MDDGILALIPPYLIFPRAVWTKAEIPFGLQGGHLRFLRGHGQLLFHLLSPGFFLLCLVCRPLLICEQKRGYLWMFQGGGPFNELVADLCARDVFHIQQNPQGLRVPRVNHGAQQGFFVFYRLSHVCKICKNFPGKPGRKALVIFRVHPFDIHLPIQLPFHLRRGIHGLQAAAAV